MTKRNNTKAQASTDNNKAQAILTDDQMMDPGAARVAVKKAVTFALSGEALKSAAEAQIGAAIAQAGASGDFTKIGTLAATMAAIQRLKADDLRPVMADDRLQRAAGKVIAMDFTPRNMGFTVKARAFVMTDNGQATGDIRLISVTRIDLDDDGNHKGDGVAIFQSDNDGSGAVWARSLGAKWLQACKAEPLVGGVKAQAIVAFSMANQGSDKLNSFRPYNPNGFRVWGLGDRYCNHKLGTVAEALGAFLSADAKAWALVPSVLRDEVMGAFAAEDMHGVIDAMTAAQAKLAKAAAQASKVQD